ncbi:MAG: hypothetical protein M1433_02715 [Candidatus Parvarchaeota archaeon]|nr:hypothetical protein [Candidatus Parvarchaeota archaeon]
MEKLEVLLNKKRTGYLPSIPLIISAQDKINRINYYSSLEFIGLSIFVSIAAGYAVYKYLKQLNKNYR